MTLYDDPNREAVGLEPIWENSGDNVPGTVDVTATDLDVHVALAGGLSNSTYDVDWGDGTTGTITTGSAGGGTANHTYAAAGTYTITVARSDGASTSETVTVTAPAGGG